LLGFALDVSSEQAFDLPLHARYGLAWSSFGLVAVLSGLLIFLGWAVLGSALESCSYSVELRIDGFRVRSGSTREEVRWADVQSIREVTRWRKFSPQWGSAASSRRRSRR
jgi:hypothetical protein